MKLVSLNKPKCITKLFTFCTLIFLLEKFKGFCYAKPTSILEPGHDNGRDLEKEIIYPFQQYIQVRKEYTVEHVPPLNDDHEHSPSVSKPKKSKIQKTKWKYGNRSESQRNKANTFDLDPFTSSSNIKDKENSEDYDEDQEDDQDEEEHNGSKGKYAGEYESSDSHSHSKPRLTEEITDQKKQEVYEEKGYSDGAYDHGGYGKEERHQTRDDNHPYDDENHPQQGYSSAEESRHIQSKRKPHLSENRDGTSTKLLEYAASNLYDKDAHRQGSIYSARSNIYCPEVIDFNLSSKKMKMGEGGQGDKSPRGAQGPRLKGLGSKIKCLKEKYFGREPLPKAMFLDPSESRHSLIRIPSFDQFLKGVKNQVSFVSDFQNF